MGRLIDADKLNRKNVNCANVPMNFIDIAPTIEAIPKDQYETKLKADLVAMLKELKAEIEQLPTTKCTETCRIYIYADNFKENVIDIIDKYKAENEDNNAEHTYLGRGVKIYKEEIEDIY